MIYFQNTMREDAPRGPLFCYFIRDLHFVSKRVPFTLLFAAAFHCTPLLL